MGSWETRPIGESFAKRIERANIFMSQFKKALIHDIEDLLIQHLNVVELVFLAEGVLDHSKLLQGFRDAMKINQRN